MNFWDSRYSSEEYIYGKEPNRFFKNVIDNSAPGKILLPADGEGRNGVYAATLGWEVHAFDSSKVAREKCFLLANDKNVSINYVISGLEEFAYPNGEFSAVALIHVHMPPNLRREVHAKCINSLKPKGKFILEAFSKGQINFKSGGPPNIDLLYDEHDIYDDLKTLQNLSVSTRFIHLEEGEFHQGKAEVIRAEGEKQ